MDIKKAIICCKSFHARRCLSYYEIAYPDTEIFICPCDIDGISKGTWHKSSEGIETVLGEMERLGAQFKYII